MLVVEARSFRDGKKLVLTVEGHATGSVEACAGASALACALAGYLERYEKHRSCALGQGKTVLRCEDTESARIAFEVIETGFAMLAETEPERVRFQALWRW